LPRITVLDQHLEKTFETIDQIKIGRILAPKISREKRIQREQDSMRFKKSIRFRKSQQLMLTDNEKEQKGEKNAR
jgi:hypothetical protein